MRSACAYAITIHQVGGYIGGYMFNAPNVVIEAKDIVISKVYLDDQQIARELLNNMLDVAYSCGQMDGMNTAKDLVRDLEMGVAL
jgi:hypothetical protein